MNRYAPPLSFAILLVAAGTGSALAEKADRDKPVQLEATKVTVDDVKRTHVFDGNVVLIQGTLVIRSAKLVVTQDNEGFQRGVATGGEGGLARFRQKREGKEEYIDGEGERIEYDSRGEKAEFFNRAYVKSGMDEVRGSHISYDGKTEQYQVTSTSAGRVTAVIQPKSVKNAPTGTTAAPTAPTPASGPAR